MKFQEFLNELTSFSIEERFDYAMKNQLSICGGNELAGVLIHLREEDRFSFAKNHLSKTCYGSHFSDVLAIFPKEKRLELAKAHHDRIMYDGDTAKMLDLLPEEAQLEFIKTHTEIIKGGEDLAKALQLFPKEERIDFAKTNKNNIRDGSNLLRVLEELPTDTRLEFTILCQELIDSAETLARVIGKFPEIERTAFTYSHLEQFPLKKTYSIVPQQKNKIHTSNDVEWILYRLQPNDRFPFVQKYEKVIKHGYYYLRGCQYCIEQEHNDLSRILKILPEKDQLKLMKTQIAKINSLNELANILSSIQSNHHLSLLEKGLASLNKRFFKKANFDAIKDHLEICSNQFYSFFSPKLASINDVVQWINKTKKSYLEIKKAAQVLGQAHRGNPISKPKEIMYKIASLAADPETHTEKKAFEIIENHFNKPRPKVI